MSQTLFQTTFSLRRPGVVIFVDIIKIVTIFIRTIFKDPNKIKITENYVN